MARRGLLTKLGPGFITGASDDDPSGIGTYAQAGAALGYGTLWVAPLTLPLMVAIQFICAKIGMVSGMGLAGVLRRHYPPLVTFPVVALLVIANTVNAGVDIGAIGEALHLLVPQLAPAWTLAPIALALLALQIWGSYRLIERTFKWLALALLAYLGSAVLAHPDWGAALHGTLLPQISFDRTYLATLVALLGTTISPYLFFWQASQEVEDEKALGRVTLAQREGATDEELHDAAVDVNLGMGFSQLVMYFIILATAATLHVAGRTDVQTAADAAVALRPLAGEASALLLAMGLIGAGCLAVPVLTGSAAFAVCEALGWECSLDAKPRQAVKFYGVITACTLVGLGVNYLGVNPMKALFWTAVLNGVLAPPVMVVIMLIARSKTIMGEHVNGTWTNVLGWGATVLMGVAAIALVISYW